MVSSYNLLSIENDTVTYLFVEYTEDGGSKITYILNIKELIEHSQYQISVIDTSTGLQNHTILHATLLNTTNLYTILFNAMHNPDNLLIGIEPTND